MTLSFQELVALDEQGLEAVLTQISESLLARGWMLATAESCTGGMIAAACTDLSGSSQWFERGFVSYSNAAKTDLLGVPAMLILLHGAVSEPVARAMATGAVLRSQAQVTIAVTGVAGPGGGTESKPVGLVYVALSHGQDVWLRELRPHGRYLGREWTRRLASSHALDMLRRRLAGLDVEALWTVAAL